MRLSLSKATLPILSLFLFGCYPPQPPPKSLYQNWGDQLSEMPLSNARVEDVSMVLGVPPLHCDKLVAHRPAIGVKIDSSEPLIISVTPNSPADLAGIRAGDKIDKINEQVITDTDELIAVIQNANEGTKIEFESSRGVFSVTPRLPKIEQCYWDVNSGQASELEGRLHVRAFSNDPNLSASSRLNYFRASCRFADGYAADCRSNWQE